MVLYFPIRAIAGQALFDPGGLTTPQGLLQHVLAQGFLDDVLYFNDPASLLDRLAVSAGHPGHPVRLAVADDRGDRLDSTSGVASNASTAAQVVPDCRQHRAHLAGDDDVQILPGRRLSHARVRGTGAGHRTGSPAHRAGFPLPRLQPTVLAACLLPAALNVVHAAPSFVALSHNREIRATSEATLRDAPPSSTILADWYWITPLRYLQVVEGLRPDVELEYVVPSDIERYERTWRRRLVDAFSRGPVIVTNYYDSYAGLPFTLAPFHEGFVATSEPLPVPAQAAHADIPFGAELELVASSLDQAGVSPGGSLPMRIWWQPLNANPGRDYSVFVHLIGSDGKPLAQDDVRYSAAELRRGRIITQDSRLAMPADIPRANTR